ncbi:hypothetical protein LIA77_10917 [Sarocladium implicatum]|nr:hypothetical protein LIA77_10917 [Sarocladium implicatum]
MWSRFSTRRYGRDGLRSQGLSAPVIERLRRAELHRCEDEPSDAEAHHSLWWARTFVPGPPTAEPRLLNIYHALQAIMHSGRNSDLVDIVALLEPEAAISAMQNLHHLDQHVFVVCRNIEPLSWLDMRHCVSPSRRCIRHDRGQDSDLRGRRFCG